MVITTRRWSHSKNGECTFSRKTIWIWSPWKPACASQFGILFYQIEPVFSHSSRPFLRVACIYGMLGRKEHWTRSRLTMVLSSIAGRISASESSRSTSFRATVSACPMLEGLWQVLGHRWLSRQKAVFEPTCARYMRSVILPPIWSFMPNFFTYMTMIEDVRQLCNLTTVLSW